MRRFFTTTASLIVQLLLLALAISWFINSGGEEPLMAIIVALAFITSLIFKFFFPEKKQFEPTVAPAVDPKPKVVSNTTYEAPNVPNALIYTQGQSGGTNIVNQPVELPKPTVEFVDSKMNEQVNRIIGMGIRSLEKPDPNAKYFKSTMRVNYFCSIPQNGFGYLVRRHDIVHMSLTCNGMNMIKNGTHPDGKFATIERPSNGIYSLVVYTTNPMINIRNEAQLLL